AQLSISSPGVQLFSAFVPKGYLMIFGVPDDDRVACKIDNVSLLKQGFLRARSLEDLGLQLIVELIQLPGALGQLDVLLFQLGDETFAIMFKHITFVEFDLRNNVLIGRGVMKGVEDLHYRSGLTKILVRA